MEENKNKTVEEITVQEIADEEYKSGLVHYIDSREVAEMVKKKHTDLIRDIKRYGSQIAEINKEDPKRKIAFSDFFIESSYSVESQSRTYPCYLITMKGCEFIAHKLTGKKGTEFTARYIKRFHEMKSILEERADLVFEEFIKQQLVYNQQQTEAINTVVNLAEQMINRFERLESLESDGNRRMLGDLFLLSGVNLEERMKNLNDLVEQVAALCGMDRNKVLHYMYKALEECMNVSLNPYLLVMKYEIGDMGICNLHVIASVDRFYEKAVEMNEDVIARKKLFD